MLTKQVFHDKIKNGLYLLDGATGSMLMAAGMPKGCCTEAWVLAHPRVLLELQGNYAAAGSQILYAPTFQAQPLGLAREGLEKDTERINAALVALTRQVAPDRLVAGDMTTLAGFCNSWDENSFDTMVSLYRRQIRGLVDGGADLIGAETLLYPLEAEAILTAAELEGAGCLMYSFTMQPDGSLFSGREAGPVLKELEQAGAAAVGFNCVAADGMTAGLVAKLRRYTKVPLICKPNAGMPVIGADGLAHYPMEPQEFGRIMADCKAMGAQLLGGCCGTDPRFIAELQKSI